VVALEAHHTERENDMLDPRCAADLGVAASVSGVTGLRVVATSCLCSQ
jgi:hypothetical protein